MKVVKQQFRGAAQSGFTLIEVMVVLVMIGILGTFVVLNVIDRPDQARTQKAQNDIRTIESALNLYRLDTFSYPTTEQGLAVLVPKYIQHLPEDPWKKTYLYLSPGDHGEMDIFTLGSDGLEGGEGQAADIGNWNIE
ncbi:type II secretion system major pseudopilin GspG [Solemya velum gill symbiont]|uniref:Type II secretion system core protein G n=1 Tax=Solemya velum gill symbiont TaxID=2340 RepID=A0A0B0HAK9_SOVGS|nr:type II secretion system major pseudopilin GspG [Solemya velum gill symbiont]KHF25717.1 type II protein secretion system GspDSCFGHIJKLMEO, subunit G [Solemya velum gill symbiont]OOY35685.1 type II secretion system protein GspG [Solemya velum gill symbiont]OOY38313.1 type II secretion system protein GspG [Solemya velum gill symbiont]OOY40770.1 type II secretion system protein GspG [Solemya velum gill symbiont]OOY44448.1 type II secretion system protein GspG [Solemya velum gill symbiont]